MQKLMAKDADRIEILHETWYYELRSVHHNKLCRLDTVYSRRLSETDGRIAFELIRCTQESKVAPKLVSSKGYYEIKPDPEGAILSYYEKHGLRPSVGIREPWRLSKLWRVTPFCFLKK